MAMLALLENEFVTKKEWMSKDEFLTMAAIAESTPGPIAINAATYLGYRRAGVMGSLFATVGVVIPSFLIIYVVSLFLDEFMSLTVVSFAFQGIRAAVVYLILSAGLKMLKHENMKKPLTATLVSLTVIVMVTLSFFAISFSSVFYILIGGVVGVVVYFLSQNAERKGNR